MKRAKNEHLKEKRRRQREIEPGCLEKEAEVAAARIKEEESRKKEAMKEWLVQMEAEHKKKAL